MKRTLDPASTATVEKQSRRSAGVLLHPTSLPSPYGIGDLGPAAHAWIDSLVRADLTWWQTLPLGPTGYGDSPYQSLSSFAGNPNLISPDLLIEDNLLGTKEIVSPGFPTDRVDFGQVIPFKDRLLQKAWSHFLNRAKPEQHEEFARFQEEESSWLDDFSLFMALKNHFEGRSCQEWPAALIRRDPVTLKEARDSLRDPVQEVQFRQWLFYRQWKSLKAYANRNGIKLVGDIPIFVAGDSVDTWANPKLFLLDEKYQPRVVAGVPPDYFSATGQLWGNPLYDWEVHQKTGFAWWIKRIEATLAQVDLIRLDHFRGFEAAWHIPAGSLTAEKGSWVSGPGEEFFQAVKKALGHLPLIAEDLGEITDAVRTLRDQFQLPGMRILQFAWGHQPKNPFLPHNFDKNCVVYTGTHDNDTTRGWYEGLDQNDRSFIWRYLGKPHIENLSISWDLIRLAWSSVAEMAIVPLQDLLNLDTKARMNLPGRQDGNWHWRFTPAHPVEGALQGLREYTWLYRRKRQEQEKPPEKQE